MKIELSHKWCELDNRHEFGIEFMDDENHIIYIRWIYYFMGKYLGDFKPVIYPFKSGKVIKTYKSHVGADRMAKYIVNAINKKLGR